MSLGRAATAAVFIQDEFSVEVCCGIIRALQSFQTQVENFPLETSFKRAKYSVVPETKGGVQLRAREGFLALIFLF